METIVYKGYKIIYFPEGFKPATAGKAFEDISTNISILKGNEEVENLKFIIPIPKSFSSGLSTQELIKLAIPKSKEIIDKGLENNEFKEFEFINGEFEEVIDTTK